MLNKRKNKDFNPNNCPMTHCLNKIGGKWKPIVLFLIIKEKNRFSMLQKAIPTISKQTLTNQLRELEEDKLITKTKYNTSPPTVKYHITAYGKTLLPVIQCIADWGKEDIKRENPALYQQKKEQAAVAKNNAENTQIDS